MRHFSIKNNVNYLVLIDIHYTVLLNFFRSTIMKRRPAREWDYLPPHICKYCGQRFYNDVTRYLFHKRHHEKWIRPFWFDWKSAQAPKYSNKLNTAFLISRGRKVQFGNDSSVIIDCVQMKTCTVLLRDIGLDKTYDFISNSSVDIHNKDTFYQYHYWDKNCIQFDDKTIVLHIKGFIQTRSHTNVNIATRVSLM